MLIFSDAIEPAPSHREWRLTPERQRTTEVETSDTRVKEVPLTRQQVHREWNLTLHYGPTPDTLQNEASGLETTE